MRIPDKISKKVESFSQIKKLSERLQEMLEKNDFGIFQNNKTSFALHHSQIDADAFNFFVIKRDLVKAKPNEIVVIINPEIIDTYEGKKVISIEGCLSFPFRRDKEVKRYPHIKVRFQVPDDKEELIEKELEVRDFMAFIFQHEIEHGKGRHIYSN